MPQQLVDYHTHHTGGGRRQQKHFTYCHCNAMPAKCCNMYLVTVSRESHHKSDTSVIWN